MEALHELKGVMKNLGTAFEIAEGDRHEPDLFFAHRAIQAAPATARRPVAWAASRACRAGSNAALTVSHTACGIATADPSRLASRIPERMSSSLDATHRQNNQTSLGSAGPFLSYGPCREARPQARILFTQLWPLQMRWNPSPQPAFKDHPLSPGILDAIELFLFPDFP